jgi:hypothetical protein
MKRWVCDKCGRDFDHEFKESGSRVLWELRYNEWTVPIAEVCNDCRKLLDSVINQFFGKTLLKGEELKSE